MKPFDLERAKAGDPIAVVQHGKLDTRYEVEFLHGDMGGVYPVLARYRYRGDPVWSTGRYEARTKELCMLPKKRTVYVNLYRNGGAEYWYTADTASSTAQKNAIAIAVPVEIEE